MTEQELNQAIESTKRTVLRAIHSNLPAHLAHLVEDVVQETYLRYFLHYKDKPPLIGNSQEAWLYTTARNECRRFARKSRREHFAVTRMMDEFQDEDIRQKENQIREKREEREKWLKSNLQNLPLSFQETVRMRLAGFKVEYIASQLNIPSGTVKSRLARATEWLARLTKENYLENEVDL